MSQSSFRFADSSFCSSRPTVAAASTSCFVYSVCISDWFIIGSPSLKGGRSDYVQEVERVNHACSMGCFRFRRR